MHTYFFKALSITKYTAGLATRITVISNQRGYVLRSSYHNM